ncbi:MAG: 50S ribosomal protein L6 [Sneathiellaceae bacterium]
MSRIGRMPVEVPSGVQVTLAGQDIRVKGPKGELSMTLMDEVKVEQDAKQLRVLPVEGNRRARTMWGMQRTLVSNMVEGVANGFTINLELVGVGYRAAVQGNELVLQLGYSHEVKYEIPKEIQISVDKQTAISISGADRQQVGQIAAEIRAWRRPEPYKGKGVKYAGEQILRKEGKKK